MTGKDAVVWFRDAVAKTFDGVKRKKTEVMCSASVFLPLQHCTLLQNSAREDESKTWIIWL
jgi:hypothetical protein